MERDYFILKTQVSFAIATDDSDVEPAAITEDLKLTPNRCHKKGEMLIGKHTGTVGIKPRTVWVIDSDWTTHEEETVSHHIAYFKKIFLSRADVLKKYKEDNRFDLSFWITIKTDNVGCSFDLIESELAFFNDFSNRVTISVLMDSTLNCDETTS